MIRPRLLAGLAALALVAAVAASGPAGAAHDPGVAPIHPGVQTVTDGAQCTANFVFTDGASTYLGQAAHCAGTGGSTDTDGCESGSLPLGTQVEVDGATKPATLAYSSWLTMQALREADAHACAYNDFALLRLDPADAGRVSPVIPVLGGPTGVDRDGSRFGERVYSYGSSGLRLGVSRVSPKEGVSLGSSAGGWRHAVYTATPGVPGDSGSAFVDGDGEALGILSTLSIAPLAGSNGVTDLARALDYANTRGGMAVSLVRGGAFRGAGAVVRGLLEQRRTPGR